MGRLKGLGELERQVLEFLWEHGPATGEAVRAAIDKDRPLSDSTIRMCCRAPNSGQLPILICGAFLNTAKGEDISGHETMMRLAIELSRMLDRDVIDKTGIPGVFDIRMQLTVAEVFHGLSRGPDRPPIDTTPDPSEPAGASIFAALQKLGLKLEAAKASSDFLVIDRVDRPSEN